jgi:hypothetical protein
MTDFNKFLEIEASTRGFNRRNWASRSYLKGGCRVCDNRTNEDGYLRVRCPFSSRTIMAHVLVWETLNGPKPEGVEINHKCGNRRCFNPDHLELMDGSEHATHTNINRVGYGHDRKSDEEIADFYYQIKYSNVAINEIVRQHGIKRSTMSSIMNKRSRKIITNAVDEYAKALEMFT